MTESSEQLSEKGMTRQQPTLARLFLRGEAHFSFWMLLTRGAGLLSTVLILSSLTLYQYGVFQLLLSIAGALAAVFSLGGAVIMNEVSRLLGEGREAVAKYLFYEYTSIRIGIGIIVWCCLYFGSSLFSDHYSIEFIREIRIISFFFLAQVLITSASSLLKVRLRFSEVAWRSAFYKIVQFGILGWFFLFSKIGLKEVLVAVAFSSAIYALSFIYPVLTEVRRWSAFTSVFSGSMIIPLFKGYGKWDLYRQSLAKLIASANPWLIKIFISTEAVAIFSVATMLLSGLVDLLPVRTLPSLIPLHISDRTKSQRIFTFGIKYLLLLSVVLILVASVAVPIGAHFFFQQYASAIPYFEVMLLSLPITALGAFTSVFIISLRRQKFLFFQEVSKSTVTFGIYLVFVPLFGLWGVVLERLVAPLILFLTSYYYLHVHSRELSVYWRDILTFTGEDRLFIQNIWSMVRRR